MIVRPCRPTPAPQALTPSPSTALIEYAGPGLFCCEHHRALDFLASPPSPHRHRSSPVSLPSPWLSASFDPHWCFLPVLLCCDSLVFPFLRRPPSSPPSPTIPPHPLEECCGKLFAHTLAVLSSRRRRAYNASRHCSAAFFSRRSSPPQRQRASHNHKSQSCSRRLLLPALPFPSRSPLRLISLSLPLHPPHPPHPPSPPPPPPPIIDRHPTVIDWARNITFRAPARKTTSDQPSDHRHTAH